MIGSGSLAEIYPCEDIHGLAALAVVGGFSLADSSAHRPSKTNRGCSSGNPGDMGRIPFGSITMVYYFTPTVYLLLPRSLALRIFFRRDLTTFANTVLIKRWGGWGVPMKTD